jgi:hypothetical protein
VIYACATCLAANALTLAAFVGQAWRLVLDEGLVEGEA